MPIIQMPRAGSETRLLVCDEAGGVYGVDYKWRADHSDADLLPAQLTENVPIKAASGTTQTQAWYYPSREDCLTCHNARAGGVLGVNTRQMNHPFAYPGVTDNELRAWNHLGLFTPAIDETRLATFDKLAASGDATRSLEDRARSYLDANCSHCHQPGGTVAGFDARYDTPLDRQELLNGSVLIDEGIDRPRIIAPHDIWRSIAYMRVNTAGDIRMPPLAAQHHRPSGRGPSRGVDPELAGPVGSRPAVDIPGRRYVRRTGRGDPGRDRARCRRALHRRRQRARHLGHALRPTDQTDRPDGHSHASLQGWLHSQHHHAGRVHRR